MAAGRLPGPLGLFPETDGLSPDGWSGAGDGPDFASPGARFATPGPLETGCALEFYQSFLPEWLLVARREEGVQEKRSLEENEKRILEYLATAPGLKNLAYKVLDKATKKMVETEHKMSEVEETPWCACFVNWCLIKAGLPRGPGALAKRWLTHGTMEPIGQPRVGAIAVVYKEPTRAISGITATGFHVAFYVGGPPSAPILLGGNQENRVCRKSFAGWSVKGYCWPVEVAARRRTQKNRAK